ncbi:MAG TPA: hypothetical protein VMV03_10415 [Spirochaetia bacterium]|nr:hypothetical protein [Spirochaetia bacterium]
MRKLVVAIIVLLALFSVFRLYSQAAGPQGRAGVRIYPGLVELADGDSSLGLSFGVMEKAAGQERVSLFPLRAVVTNGDRSVSIGLNGFSFLLGTGAIVGTPVTVTGVRRTDLVNVGGPVTVDGRVEGDVWTVGSSIQLTGRADVTGDVVAIGGRVAAAPGAAVGGAVSQLPGLKIPLIGWLGTGFSAQALRFAGTALSYVLFGFALFISTYYFMPHARGLLDAMPALWRRALITAAIAAVAVPLIVALLIASVVGVLLLPILALLVFLFALDGFLVVCVQVGGWLRGKADRPGDPSLHLFTSGLLALFLINAPALVGILLTVTRSAAVARVGAVLQALAAALTAAGLLYGFGSSLAFARTRAAVTK